MKYITFYIVLENVSPKTIQMEINYYYNSNTLLLIII